MGNRPKVKKERDARAFAENEAWLAEVSTDFDDAGASKAGSAPPRPRWPFACAAACNAACDALASRSALSELGAAATATRALRLSRTFGGKFDTAWMEHVEAALSAALRPLRFSELEADVRSFERGNERFRARSPGGALCALEPLAAIDTLALAIWGTAGQKGEVLEHPAVLAADVERGLLSRDGVAAAVRRLLRAAPATARCWGARKTWLDTSQGSAWKPGACPLLILLRARWVEGVAAVLAAAPSSGGCAADEARVRTALYAWQFAGRDGGARWMSFAVPSAAALSALAEAAATPLSPALTTAGGATRRDPPRLVELGAHNGLWARELHARHGVEVDALDIAPPPQPVAREGEDAGGAPSTRPPAVRFGTAESLADSQAGALLLCMPSPGEAGLADDAIRHFRGACVAYVGEWGSGMSGTQHFHERLASSAYECAAVVPLPCVPKLRLALHIFFRRPPSAKPAVAPTALQTCDVCGAPTSRADGGVLRRCPWTRSLRVCGAACYAAADGPHRALLDFAFCGAPLKQRPPLDEWEPCVWLAQGRVSDLRWNALRDATPQAELKPAGAPKPRAHGAAGAGKRKRAAT